MWGTRTSSGSRWTGLSVRILRVTTIQERRNGRDEPAGVIKPGVVASNRLDNEPGRGEQRGELGGYRRRPLQVQASGEHQHRRAERGKRRAGGRRGERSFGGKGTSRILVTLLLFRGLVSPGSGIPAAVEERGHGLPVLLGSRAVGYPREGSSRLREPRLIPAKPDDLAPHRTARLQADRPPARRDQGEPGHPPWMPYRILHGDICAGRVPQQVDAGQGKMILQGRDVVHQPVAAVAHWIGGDCRFAGAP